MKIEKECIETGIERRNRHSRLLARGNGFDSPHLHYYFLIFFCFARNGLIMEYMNFHH